MNCERARERMMEWMDGRLDPATATELKAHVDRCPECQRELAGMRRMMSVLDASVAVKPSPNLRRGVLAAIAAEKSDADRPPSPSLRRVGARWTPSLWRLTLQLSGACALVLAGFLAGHRTGGSNPVSPASAPATQQDIAALNSKVDSMGQLVNFTLQRQQSATTNQRLEGVLATASLHKPDKQAIDGLIGTLALDPSANVRLNAVQALYANADQEVVRTAIEISLPREQSPLVQLAMIDFLTASKDRDARPVLEKLSANESADANVREAATRALNLL